MDIAQTLRTLCRLPHLEPRAIADLLDRRLRILSDNEFRTEYRVDGGVEIPFTRVRAGWLKERKGGWVSADVAERHEPALASLGLEEWGRPFPILADPRNPNPRECLAYRVPVGELKVIHRDKKLLSFGISEVPVLGWR